MGIMFQSNELLKLIYKIARLLKLSIRVYIRDKTCIMADKGFRCRPIASTYATKTNVL